MDLSIFKNKLNINGRTEDAVFFFAPEDPYGAFSNWYMSPFRLDGLDFCCNEQYIMYRKALALGDAKTASAIMASSSPAEHQALGRKVKGYNAFIWEGLRQTAALKGLLAKFRQNPALKEELLGTGNAWLVECHRGDNVWSCGLNVTDPARLDCASWKGYNILGAALMETRALLLDEQT